MKKNPFATPRRGEEVLPGVHLLGSRRVNFYVVEEGRSLTLIDCGFDGHLRYLDAWLERRGRRTSDVEAILLTHGHADHVGFAERFRARGVPVYLDAADAAFAMRPEARRPPQRLRRSLWRPSVLALFGEAVCDGVFSQPLLKETRPLPRGAALDVPGRPVVVPVPAHSAGSVAFRFPSRGALFTGDALMTRDPMLGGPDRSIVFAEHTDQNQAALEALRHLTPYGDDALLPAHGDAWVRPGSVARAIEEAVIAV
jgi:glyoxylase-like metal-dependent hydrolase (beta-lactamase superfamily II)